MIKNYLLQFGRIGKPQLKAKSLAVYFYSQIKKILLFAYLLLICISCQNNTTNKRTFEFTYVVNLEASENNKLELWLPLPQSNEVQTISNLNIDSQGLNYEIKDEIDHGNKYLYMYAENGIKTDKEVIVKFNVVRQEHQNVEYDNIDASKYLDSFVSL